MSPNVFNVAPPHLMAGAALVILYFAYRIYSAHVPLVTKYLAFAICARFAAAEFPAYTFRSFGGVSIIALVSLSTVMLGVYVLKTRMFMSVLAIPCYIYIFITLASGALNSDAGEAIDTSIKIMYFLVIALATFRSVAVSGVHDTAKFVLFSYGPPLLTQFMALAIGFAKASEADGSASIIGGYNHEAGFSLVSVGALFLASLMVRKQKVLGMTLVAAATVSLILANYRTALAGAIFMLLVSALLFAKQAIQPSQRAILPLVFMPLVVVFLAGAFSFQDRFSDLFVSANDLNQLLVSPEYYTADARHLMSGRPYIWSSYIYSYLKGDNTQLLFGYGPGSWQDEFPVYAHNTFVSALYETGIFGVFSTVFFIFGYFFYSFRAASSRYFPLFLAGFVGFLVLNMATMPFWNIEGIILYALMVGFSAAEGHRIKLANMRNWWEERDRAQHDAALPGMHAASG